MRKLLIATHHRLDLWIAPEWFAERLRKDFPQQRLWGQEAIWEQSGGPREIAGTTLGMVGLGSIGHNVARHAAALGMRVIAVRQHADATKPDSVHEVLPPSKINEMFAAADYIVLAAPVTSATRHMIGREQLALMKSDAYLINVGRGSLIDEAALLEVLQQRKIGGAALDVFDQEPLPPDSPLWDVDNLLITPHTAGMTAKLRERHYTLFSENVRRYLSGQPLLALVDKKSGY